MSEYIKVKEVADLLETTPQKINRWCHLLEGKGYSFQKNQKGRLLQLDDVKLFTQINKRILSESLTEEQAVTTVFTSLKEALQEDMHVRYVPEPDPMEELHETISAIDGMVDELLRMKQKLQHISTKMEKQQSVSSN